MTRHIGAVMSALTLACSVQAQVASVVVSHDDADGLVAPGETVRVTMKVSWSDHTVQLRGFAGDLTTSPTFSGGIGSISNRSSPLTPGSMYNFGTIIEDDIRGISIEFTSAFFTPQPLGLSFMNTGVNFFSHDWTAPSVAGAYEFRFEPSPAQPFVQLYPSPLTPFWVNATTHYAGATLTVVPAPPVAVVLARMLLSRSKRIAR